MGLLTDYIKRGWAQEDLAKQQQSAQALIGAPSQQIDQGQPVQQMQEIDPTTGEQYSYEKSVLPTTQAGTGYLGAMEGLITPQQQAEAQLYGGLIGTPGMENIGAQGLQGLIGGARSEKATAAKQKAALGASGFSNEKDLRNQFTKETKTFVEINDAYGRIKASAKEPDAAGDLSMIFAYMKMLDPGSVVRESEFATAEAAASVPERLKGVYNKAVSGQKLTELQRNQFINRAGMLFNQANEGFGIRRGRFNTLANAYGLDASRVTYDRAIHDRYVRPEGLLLDASVDNQRQGRLIGGGQSQLPAGFVRDK